MKKMITAAISSMLALTTAAAALPICGNAAFDNKYGNGKHILVIGDEIAAGTNLKESEYSYGELLASYCGGSVKNYAEPKMDVAKLNTKLTELSKQTDSDLKNADVVVLSVGGADMTGFASAQLLQLAEQMGWLKNGYTAETVPETINLSNIYDILDASAVQEFLNGGLMNKAALLEAIVSIKSDLTVTSKDKNSANYEKIIETKIIPGIESAVKTIKAANPKAEVVVQNLYDPLQLEASFSSKLSSSKRQALETVAPMVTETIQAFNTQLKGIDGIKIADVYTDFTSQNADGNKFSYYFTDMQKTMQSAPNQMGHLAIAVSVIDQLGNDYRFHNTLPASVFCAVKDKSAYPETAYKNFMENVGPQLGDVNMDGSIDASDATAILIDYTCTSTGEKGTIAELVRPVAEITNDGRIDSSDATQVLRYYSYLSTGGKKSFIDFFMEG